MAQLRTHRNLYGAVPMDQQLYGGGVRYQGTTDIHAGPRTMGETGQTRRSAPQDNRGLSSTVQTKTRLSFGMILLALTAVIVLSVMLVLNVSMWSQSSKNQQQIDALRRGIADIEQTNAMLEDDIKYAMDGDKICNYAINRLGMRPQSESQTRYISLEGVVGTSQ